LVSAEFESLKSWTTDDVRAHPIGHAPTIPVIGWVQAGKFTSVEGIDIDASDVVYSDIKGRNLFALRVHNDSMEPDFRPGDILIVNPNLEAQNGEQEAVFKRYHLSEEKKKPIIELRPLNSKYQR